MSSNINIRTFVGPSIKTYIHSLARLRIEVFKEYPFLSKINLEEEVVYLKKFTQHTDSIAIVVFDGPKIVGASIGAPFENQEAEFLKIFEAKELNPSHYFYFGQSCVLAPYRGRGLGHHFFDIREKHVRRLKKFKDITFCSIERPRNHPLMPEGYSSLANFWEKSGYVKRPDMTCTKSWQDIGDDKETSKTLVFWVKKI